MQPGKKYFSDCIVESVKHPCHVQVMIWSVISGKVTGCLYMIKGTMQQDEYKLLRDRLLPHLREWFPNGEPFVFKQDGATCHTTWSVQAFFAEESRKRMSLYWLGWHQNQLSIRIRYESDWKYVQADEEGTGSEYHKNLFTHLSILRCLCSFLLSLSVRCL